MSNIQPNKQDKDKLLVEHFFRKEYGKMLAVISRYVGIEAAEDIVQETLLSAVDYWQHNGIPENPQAWLYLTAKNKSFNWLRKLKYEKDYRAIMTQENELVALEFNEHVIADEQLRVMLSCCAPSVSKDTQIALILKILCGFSISEIASAFCTKEETINKRLVRGRKKLRDSGIDLNSSDVRNNLDVLLKTIYLLFNEGYFPSRNNQIIRKDLCLEAIRLAEIILVNKKINPKDDVHALIALMCLNCARFEARIEQNDTVIEMEQQNRVCWNQELINKGLYHLGQAQTNDSISKYLILASISANHCIAPTYDQTDWNEILSLYDTLIKLENSAIVSLNRLVAFSKVHGPAKAISGLLKLRDLISGHLYFSTLAALYKDLGDHENAVNNYHKAISLAPNIRDKTFLVKKLNTIVPIS